MQTLVDKHKECGNFKGKERYPILEFPHLHAGLATRKTMRYLLDTTETTLSMQAVLGRNVGAGYIFDEL